MEYNIVSDCGNDEQETWGPYATIEEALEQFPIVVLQLIGSEASINWVQICRADY